MKQIVLVLLVGLSLLNPGNFYLKAQGKAGDLAPNAVEIDAEELRPFNLGAAVIKKGSSVALIDKNGRFIVPYNKYTSIVELTDPITNSNYESGFFKVDQNQVINSLGEVVNLSGSPAIEFLHGTKYLWGAKGTPPQFYTLNTNTGKAQTIDAGNDAGIRKFNYGLFPFYEFKAGRPGSFGYKNINGQAIVQPQYVQANAFSDGMAVVSILDQFSNRTYGYIDSTGRMVIPNTYSQEPSNFYNGTALVFPKSPANFQFAMINKKGEIIKEFGNEVGSFHLKNWIDFHGTRLIPFQGVLGINGKYYTMPDFLNFIGVSQVKGAETKLLPWDHGDNKFYFSRKFSDGTTLTGFIDVQTRKLVEAQFISIGPSSSTGYLGFDKVSKLALARFPIKAAPGKQVEFRDGFINEDGQFLLVLKKASVF